MSVNRKRLSDIDGFSCLKWLALTLMGVSLVACVSAPSEVDRKTLALDIATSGNLLPEVYSTSLFKLQGFQRFQNTGSLVVYIEGDGHAWERYSPSKDPTPLNPLALRLAAADSSESVLYLARPCQYLTENCETKYWTSHRMAPEVIQAYRSIIQEVMEQGNFQQLRLVGFSGGGGIVLLTADLLKNTYSIKDIRTVAGNLDHQLWPQKQALIPMDGSLNPVDVAVELAHIPQLHFLGERDYVIPGYIYESYKNASDESGCVKASEQNTSHVRGWAELWDRLHRYPVSC